MSFTHLHLHTEYSLLDGAVTIPDLMTHLKEQGMTACAITDHGWMAGVVDFYKQCKKSDIKPLIGVEAYITEDEDGSEEKTRDNMHLVLIAKDNVGYQKLLDLCSNAALNNFYYKPRINKKHLRQLSGHVVATSACLGGVIAKRLAFEKDQYGKATRCSPLYPDVLPADLVFYREIFGPDFYLEVQPWNAEDNHQKVYNSFIMDLAHTHELPLVITSDAHYLKQGDHELHEVLMAMQFKTTVEKYRESGEMQYGPYFYVKGPEEMLEGARNLGCEEAFHNTNRIAEQCEVEIELGVYKPPVFDVRTAEDYQEFLEWRRLRASVPIAR
jgi:DNA polymerase-3 subunit alpha